MGDQTVLPGRGDITSFTPSQLVRPETAALDSIISTSTENVIVSICIRTPKNAAFHDTRHTRDDRHEDVGVSGDFPVQLATGQLQEILRRRRSSRGCRCRGMRAISAVL